MVNRSQPFIISSRSRSIWQCGGAGSRGSTPLPTEIFCDASSQKKHYKWPRLPTQIFWHPLLPQLRLWGFFPLPLDSQMEQPKMWRDTPPPLWLSPAVCLFKCTQTFSLFQAYLQTSALTKARTCYVNDIFLECQNKLAKLTSDFVH